MARSDEAFPAPIRVERDNYRSSSIFPRSDSIPALAYLVQSRQWVMGRCGRQADSTAALSPAPEMPGAFRHFRFVPGGDHGEDIPGQRLRAKLGITPVEYFSPEVAQGRKLAVMT